MARSLCAVAMLACITQGSCDSFLVIGPNGCDEAHPCRTVDRPHCEISSRRCLPAPPADLAESPRACRSHADCPSLVCDQYGASGDPGLCVPLGDSVEVGDADQLLTLLPKNKGIRLRPGVYQGVWQVTAHGVVIVGPHADPVLRRRGGPRAVLSTLKDGPVIRVSGQGRLTIDGATVTGGIGGGGHGIHCETPDSALWLRRADVGGNGGIGVWARCPTAITQSVLGGWLEVPGNSSGGLRAEHEISVTNTFITRNGRGDTPSGGIIILPAPRSAKVTLIHLTFVGNVGSGPGNAINCTDAGPIDLWHSLWWENPGPLGLFTIRNCKVRSAALDDAFFIEEDFVALSADNPPLFRKEHDYHLQPSSPAVDKVFPEFQGPMLPDDFDDDARPQGKLPDYGADEVAP